MIKLGFLTLLCLLPVANSEEISLLEEEIQKREEKVTVARELLLEGDTAYKKANYAKAVRIYRKAFKMIPGGGITNKIKQASADRYAQAVVENAKTLVRTGNSSLAREQLQEVLNEKVAPGNVGALKALEKLDDPIRTSPTLTLEHVQNMAEVGQLLRKGESFFLQGQYPSAIESYEKVLRIDPYNKAARRGMEQANALISDALNTAQDEARAKALAEVDAVWETPVPQEAPIEQGLAEIDSEIVAQNQIKTDTKVKRIIVPEINFRDASFDEALRIIRALTRELDTIELDEKNKGVNYVTRFGDDQAGFLPQINAVRFSLKLRNIPMSEVLDRVCQACGLYWRAERFAIVIRPLNSKSSDFEKRTFRVPANFFDNPVTQENDDVFASEQGGLKAKLTPLEYLKKLGITFPKGTYATYTKHNRTLSVTNTVEALDSIEAFIRAQSLEEQVQVVIKFTIMEVKYSDLVELGYDSLLGNTNALRVSTAGGNQGNQGSLVQPIPGVLPETTFQGQPINNGNRSGDAAFSRDSIDTLIADSAVRSANTSPLAQRAPGILQVTGAVSDTNFQLILKGVNQKDHRSEIVAPTVVTRPGQRATIHSGRDFIYPDAYDLPTLPNAAPGGNNVTPVLPTTPSSFATRSIGLTLEVDPSVSDDRNYISLNVSPTLVEFQGFVNYGNPIQQSSINPFTNAISTTVLAANPILQPVFRTIRTDTNVTIEDGQRIVIGGFLEQRVESVNDKTPILGSIPVIKRFFKTDGIRTNTTAIIIFAKAELVDPTGKPWRER